MIFDLIIIELIRLFFHSNQEARRKCSFKCLQHLNIESKDGVQDIVNQNEFEDKCEEVNNGTSKEYTNIKIGLTKARERKRATADKHRKMQIKNVHALYEYDMEDLEVQYQNALQDAKENLIEEYRRAADKAIIEVKERAQREEDERAREKANKQKGKVATGQRE